MNLIIIQSFPKLQLWYHLPSDGFGSAHYNDGRKRCPSFHPLNFSLSAIANPCPERLAPTVSLYVPVFANDPVINYMLCSMPTRSARLAYLPAYFQTLLKAAALNHASFDAIGPDGKYEACAVFMPPGKRVDNTWTLVPAGFLGCLWRMGWNGCKVCYVFPVNSKIHCLSLSLSLAIVVGVWHGMGVLQPARS
jgi:hypothetical protein